MKLRGFSEKNRQTQDKYRNSQSLKKLYRPKQQAGQQEKTTKRWGAGVWPHIGPARPSWAKAGKSSSGLEASPRARQEALTRLAVNRSGAALRANPPARSRSRGGRGRRKTAEGSGSGRLALGAALHGRGQDGGWRRRKSMVAA